VRCRARATLLASCTPAGAATTTRATARQRECSDAVSATAPASSSRQQRRSFASAIVSAGMCGQSSRGCRFLRFGGSRSSRSDRGRGSKSTECIASTQLMLALQAGRNHLNQGGAACAAARTRRAQPLGSKQERAIDSLSETTPVAPITSGRQTARVHPSAAPQSASALS
jgi:hypothetical protein